MTIRIERLTKTFSDAGRQLTVLDEVSFEFPARGSVGIIGKSGVGKSTFLHMLAGLETPTSGDVFVNGVSISAMGSDELASFRVRTVGFIFQFHNLLPEFTAWENVAMPLFIAGIGEREARERSSEILGRMGLSERLTHIPGELSGGEQQRVAIARALVANPPVILADEPTGNLDAETARDIQSVLLRTCQEQGNLLIVVTHSRELAASLERTVEMQPGGKLSEVVP